LLRVELENVSCLEVVDFGLLEVESAINEGRGVLMVGQRLEHLKSYR